MLTAVVRITAGEDSHFGTPDHPEHSAAEAVVHRFWRHKAGQVPANLAGHPKGDWPAGTHPTYTAAARVNHGRWIVDCPHPGCGGAQLASRQDHRMFCVEGPHDEHNAWVPVAWPSDVDVATIEAVLCARPDETTRNWSPGETIVGLVRENTSRDVPIAQPG